MTDNEKKMLEAIRGHRLIGRGSCASVDECYDDADLVEVFRLENIKTPDAAVKYFLESEGLWHEQNLNARWDDDPQLAAYETWMEIKSGLRG